MKRFFILMFILVLTACSGISGNDSGKPVIPQRPPNQNLPVQGGDTTNDTLTGMTSGIDNKAEIVANVESALGSGVFESQSSGNRATNDLTLDQKYNIAKAKYDQMLNVMKNLDSTDITDDMRREAYKLAGGADDVTGLGGRDLIAKIDGENLDFNTVYSENQLKNFHLDNAVFNTSDALDGNFGSQTLLTFGVDSNGIVTGINIKTTTENNLKETITAKRKADTNVFDYSDKKTEFTLLTYGRELGLKYSDFGQLVENSNTAGLAGYNPTYTAFAGGYSAKKIDIAKLQGKTMNFSGRAVGTVSAQGVNNADDLMLYSAAVLNFTDGKETLSMNFSKPESAGADSWYDVTVADGKITFSNGGNSIPDSFKFDDTALEKDFNSDNGKININYYGDGGNPIEFTGNVLYTDEQLKMQVGVGGKISQ